MAVTAAQWAALKNDPEKLAAHRARMREYRKTYDERHPNPNRHSSERARLRRIKNKAHLDEARACGCKLCPERDLDCLDFHHVDPEAKDWTVTDMLNRTLTQLKKELEKCVVLCANCHRKLHARLRRGEPSGL